MKVIFIIDPPLIHLIWLCCRSGEGLHSRKSFSGIHFDRFGVWNNV